MSRILAWILAVALVASVPTVAQDHEGHGSGSGHDFGDVERWKPVFEGAERREWQKPLEIVELLAISHGQNLADLGAGTGYFLPMLCSALGGKGQVYAVDVEPAMVEHIGQRGDPACKGVVVPILGAPDDPRLPDDEIDLVLVVNTWHHVEGRVAYLERLERALRRGGRVAVIDWREGELPIGPPPEQRLARAAVIAEFERAGWRLDSESTMLPYQYFLVFEQPGTGS